MTAADRLAEAIGAERNGRGWIARCPAHDDEHPSLSIDEGDGGKVLVICRAGCPQDALVAILKARGVWPSPLDARANRTAAGPRASQRPHRVGPPLDLSAAWARAVARARSAPPEDPARVFLARRLAGDDDAVARLIAESEIGFLDEREEHPWLRARGRDGYRLILPLFQVPPPGEVTAPVGAADLALRHVGPGDPPSGKKLLRLPSNLRFNRERGWVPFFGFPPRALMEADADALAVVEGAFDYLTLRARRHANVVGLQSATFGARAGAVLRTEIEALRTFGVGGPARVVLIDQAEDASRRAMAEIAAQLAGIPGLKLQAWSPVLKEAAA